MNIKNKFQLVVKWLNDNPVCLFLFFCLIFLCVSISFMSYNNTIIEQNALIISKIQDINQQSETYDQNLQTLYERTEDLQNQLDSVNEKHEIDIQKIAEGYSNLVRAVSKINNAVCVDRDRILEINKKLKIKTNDSYNEEEISYKSIDLEENEGAIASEEDFDPSLEASPAPSETSPPPKGDVFVGPLEVPQRPPRGVKKIFPWNWFR